MQKLPKTSSVELDKKAPNVLSKKRTKTAKRIGLLVFDQNKAQVVS